ncbi:hypothetical protein E4U15_006523 [Claviceps sp. LM218 group G6]|nr:hypothetical protein E4U15_006523 [Claviceps sp. LM218 group G6]
MSDMFNFSSPPEASNDGFRPNMIRADSGYVTVTALSTDVGTAGTAQNKRHKNPAFLNFVQVQAGLMCKACDSVLKTKDLERIMGHLCKCLKARPGDRAAAVSVYEQRYQKKKIASRLSIVTSSPSAAFPGPSAAFVRPAPTTMHKWVDCVSKSDKEDLDKELAMTFYHLGLPFSLVGAPPFVNLLN